jgi:hypothetical protein
MAMIIATAIGRMVGKSRPYVSMRMKMLKLYPSLREAVRCRTLTPSHAHALLRLEPQQQLTLAEEVKAKGLSVHEKRQRVRIDARKGAEVAPGAGAPKPRNLLGTTENSDRRRHQEAHPRNHQKANTNLAQYNPGSKRLSFR